VQAAAKSGDTAKFNAADARWYDNANQIAAFLHTATPDQDAAQRGGAPGCRAASPPASSISRWRSALPCSDR